MKRTLFLIITLSALISLPALSQGGLLKKVTGAMKDELLGTKSGSSKNQSPEPPCACSDAVLVMDMGKNKLDYSEVSICSKDDGSLLIQNKMTGDYFIYRNGNPTGPYRPGDPQVAGYNCDQDYSGSGGDLTVKYKEYISKSGDKYTIRFGGKTYGPYAMISQFGVTRSKDKFAAIVTENIVTTEDEGKKMDEAIKNAKTEQEKMQLAMQYSQQMTQKMLQGGGPQTMTPKVVTNVSEATFSPLTGARFNADMKYDDILVIAYDKILDIQGNQLLTIKPEYSAAKTIFVNSSNTRYVAYNYGTLTFSDGKSLTDLFNPYLMKSGGSVYLTYMYYSPKNNGIMQCKIPF